MSTPATFPDAYLATAVRTPVGRRGGALAEVRPDELLALTLREAVTRADLDPAHLDDVVAGCTNAVGEQGRNIARLAGLIAGFPVEVPGVTVNRMCGSSQQALHAAVHAVASGEQGLVLAAGIESMSRVPLGSDLGDAELSAVLQDRHELPGQGAAADRIARTWGIGRAELDDYSAASHHRADAAWQDGRFDAETFGVPADVTGTLRAGSTVSEGILLARDSGIRPDTDTDVLAGLEPAFRGLHTAGSSSQVSDGAAAVLVGSAHSLRRHGVVPRARVLGTAVVGVDPDLMLHGAIPATQRLLSRLVLQVDDIDLFEVNEAFAAVPLAWLRTIGADPAKVNVNGGAIAIGHPTGCSGVRLMTTLLHELERRGGGRGLQAMCIGFGMATATVIETVDRVS